jgi:IS1 family transposase
VVKRVRETDRNKSMHLVIRGKLARLQRKTKAYSESKKMLIYF